MTRAWLRDSEAVFQGVVGWYRLGSRKVFEVEVVKLGNCTFLMAQRIWECAFLIRSLLLPPVLLRLEISMAQILVREPSTRVWGCHGLGIRERVIVASAQAS